MKKTHTRVPLSKKVYSTCVDPEIFSGGGVGVFCGPGVRGLCSGILLNEFFLEEKKTEKRFYDH